MKKISLIISKILVVFFLIPLLFSFYKIIKWNIDNINTNKSITNIKDKTNITETDDTIYTNIISDSTISIKKLMSVDFTDLLNQNDEVVGWINIPNTSIDYPFVKHKNNSYYLFRSFDRSYNDAGWIFLDYRNNINELDTNTIIYGHGRLDGTMFGSLRNTLEDGWLSNKDNHVVRISTIASNYLFEVFSIYRIRTTNDYLYNNFSTDEEYRNFLNKIRGRSIYDFNVDVSIKDKIITLSTCYNNSEKLVLHGKLVKEEKRY